MSGGEYRRISTAKVWYEPRMRTLRQKSRDGHDMLLYLLTCPQGNYAGIFTLPLAYAVEDLRWSRRRVMRALNLLTTDGHIHYDPDASVVYLPQVLLWDPAGQEKQFAGIARRLESLPDTPLKATLKADLLKRGLANFGEKARPLMEYFGLIPMRQQSHSNQTATQSQSPSPSQSHTQAQAQAHTVGAEDNPMISVRGNGDGRTPLTKAEQFWENEILPLTGELHLRDKWLAQLRVPGALEAARLAVDALNGADGRGEVRNVGAFIWAKFQEIQASQGVRA